MKPNNVPRGVSRPSGSDGTAGAGCTTGAGCGVEIPGICGSAAAEKASRSATARGSAEVFLILAEQELIGHPGDVIADHQVAGNLSRGLFLRFGHRVALLKIVGKEFGEASDGAGGIFGDERMVVDVREEKALQLCVLGAGRFAESRQALGDTANFVRGART